MTGEGSVPRRRGRPFGRSVQLREHLLKMIATGRLQPGQPLPTELALSAECQVPQPTVHREIKRLIAEGVVELDRRGRRVVSIRRGGLLSRTVVLCTTFAEPETIRTSSLDTWEINLELCTEQHLIALGYLSWRVPGRRFGEREIGLLGSDGPCGVVLFSDGMEAAQVGSLRTAFTAAGISVVVHGSPNEHPGVDVVASDQESGGAAVAAWLADQGCRRLLIQMESAASTPLPHWFASRLSGIHRGASAAGLAEPAILVKPQGIEGSYGERSRFDAEAQLMADAIRPHLSGPMPLGIVATSDGEVPRIWAGIRRLGLQPGRDILLAGYDGYWDDLLERRWEPTPPSVTVDKGNDRIGEQLARTLHWRLHDGSGMPPRHQLVPPILRIAWKQ